MMKKILALAGAGAILLSMAGPAFGFTLIKNKAKVKNIVVTKADSGDNSIGGKYVTNGTIKTGAADAYACVLNDVNDSVLSDGGALIVKNKAKVKNVVITKADSGDNRIGGYSVGGGGITSGAAGATSIVTSFVNYSEVDLY